MGLWANPGPCLGRIKAPLCSCRGPCRLAPPARSHPSGLGTRAQVPAVGAYCAPLPLERASVLRLNFQQAWSKAPLKSWTPHLHADPGFSGLRALCSWTSWGLRLIPSSGFTPRDPVPSLNGLLLPIRPHWSMPLATV